MISLVFTKKSIEISGHANYAKKGHDIVCAAVSAIIQSGATWFNKKDIKYLADKDQPYIKLELLSDKQEEIDKFNLLIKQLKFIQKNYSKNIKINRR